MLESRHQDISGIQEIVCIKSLIPEGLSSKLQALVSDKVLPVKPEFIPNTNSLNSDWIAGFVTADGHFSQGFRYRRQSKYLARVMPVLTIVQNSKDLEQLRRIIETLGCGYLYPQGSTCHSIQFNGINQHQKTIIPFLLME